MTKIKIYNHNIRWSSSKRQQLQIAAKIQQLQPDIVCLQEVALEKQAKLFQIEGYSMYYHTIEKPKMVLLTSLIKPLFNLYKKYENRSLYNPAKVQKSNLSQRIKTLAKKLGQKPVKTEKNGKFLKGYLLVLIRDKPKKVIYKAYQEQGNIFGNMAERVAGKGYIKVSFGKFTIFNTHLLSSHKKKKIELNKNNENQLTELLSATDGQNKNILIGDFNFGPNSKKYSLVADWNDLTRELPVTEYFWKTRLDYILTNFDPIYSSTNIVQYENEPSDHYGIWCELEF